MGHYGVCEKAGGYEAAAKTIPPGFRQPFIVAGKNQPNSFGNFVVANTGDSVTQFVGVCRPGQDAPAELACEAVAKEWSVSR